MKSRSVSVFLTLATVALAVVIHAQASTYNVIYAFQGGTDAGFPYGPMIADSTGNLYGTTEFGGSQRFGTVFKLTKGTGGTWTESVLYNFSNGADGGQPEAGVVMDAAGNLYGTTIAGGDPTCVSLHGFCGVLYKLSPNLDGTWIESVLVNFTGTNGLVPQAGLILDSAGNLYGTTTSGGAIGYGTVFQLSNSGGTWSENILHNFNNTDGRSPALGLVFDKTGNLYGTTFSGGNLTACSGFGCGTVFELTPQTGGTWAFRLLHRFNSTNGATPEGVVLDSSGNLFGATAYGGSGSCPGPVTNGCGLVYELSPVTGGSWHEKLVKGFTGIGSSVVNPDPIVLDSSGRLFGTSLFGGRKDCNLNLETCGTIYELTPASGSNWTLTGLYAFQDDSNGFFPYAALTIDSAGNIYGSTGSGGDLNCGSTGGCGVVFQIIP
jgi:uncharacterized repeat protein (TIGR03803 family)